MYVSPAYLLKLYRNFKSLGVRDYYSIVRFYEQHEVSLNALETDKFLDCALTYTDALYQTADYGRHIVMCDYLLEFVIAENIAQWGGNDIFVLLLFRKSYSLYHIKEWAQCEYVLGQILRINPAFTAAQSLLLTCLLQQKNTTRLYLKALALVSFLLSSIIGILAFLIAEPFFESWFSTSLWFAGILLATGVLLLFTAQLQHLWRAKHRLTKYLSV